jgi:ESF2/ABP1 family protein
MAKVNYTLPLYRHSYYSTAMSTKAAVKKRAASQEPDVGLEERNIKHSVELDKDVAEDGPSTSASASRPKPKSKKRKITVPGIVYISRLPPGMTPQKVKYLMAQWGDVGKIYAQKKDGKSIRQNEALRDE